MIGGRKLAVGKRVLKSGLGLLVIAAVAAQVLRTTRALADRGERIQFDPLWLASAGGVYLLGLAIFGLVFAWLLGAGPWAYPGRLPSIRAYLLSHLGKYVPGKAMVVVMRVALLVPFGARPAVAAFATLYETLLMMAVGGWVAFLGFAFAPAGSGFAPGLGSSLSFRLPLWAPALACALGFSLLVVPRVFARLARVVSLPFPNVGPDALPRLTPRLLALGIAAASVGWILMGASQVLVLRGLGILPLALGLLPVVVASVALATVAGFAVPISPGGLGVREWVLWTSLGSTLDRERAVIAALVLRLVWVLAEIAAGAILVVWRMSSQRPSASPP